MKKILLIAVSIASFCISLNISAAGVTHKGTVSRIYVTGNGDLLFRLDQTSGCKPANSKFYYRAPRSQASFSENYALVLAAAHTMREIIVRIDDSICSDSSQGSARITYLFQDF